MNIGIFGGSFNPIHIGHCIVANHILSHSSIDEVWFNVSPQNPLKSAISPELDVHRLKMVELAIQGCHGLRLCDVEFKLPIPSFTITTLRYLKEQFPTDNFRLIIGSDNWLVFNKWRAYDEIISDFGVIVYPRPGYPIEEQASASSNVEFVEAPVIELSSTYIRNCVKSGLDIHFLSPEPVRDYIISNNLYTD